MYLCSVRRNQQLKLLLRNINLNFGHSIRYSSTGSIDAKTGDNLIKFNSQKNKTRKSKTHKNHNRKEISYEEESDKYILRELKKSQLDYESKNKQVFEIADGFQKVLQAHGLQLLKAPLPLFEEKSELIHICQKNDLQLHGDKLQFDILMDFRESSYKDSKEIQIVATHSDKTNQVLYLIGEFSKMEGILINSCIFINTEDLNISKTATEIKDAIINSESWIFSSLNNIYQKNIDVENEKVLQFLNLKEDSVIPELESRPFIDAMINFTVSQRIGLGNDANGMKLRSIFWMLSVYCENSAYGTWLEQFKSFISSK